MLYSVYTFSIIFVAISRFIGDTSAEVTSFCYIRQNKGGASLCSHQPDPTGCCRGKMVHIDGIDVYGEDYCHSVNYCKIDGDCCDSWKIVNISTSYTETIKQVFRDTQCFTNVDVSQLPFSYGLIFGVYVFYTCLDGTTAGVSTSSKAFLQAKESSTENKLVLPIAIAVPIAAVVIGVVIVVIVICIRRQSTAKAKKREMETTMTSSNGSLHISSADRHEHTRSQIDEEDSNCDYAEISDSPNSIIRQEAGENSHNVVHPLTNNHHGNRNVTPLTDKSRSNRNRQLASDTANEEYDHLGFKPATKNTGSDTYAHIGHGGTRNQHGNNVSGDMDVYSYASHSDIHALNGKTGGFSNNEYSRDNHSIPQNYDDTDGRICNHAYAHIDHGDGQCRKLGTKNVRIGSDTYSHVANGPHQGCSDTDTNVYDSTSTSPNNLLVRKKFESDETYYDHTDQLDNKSQDRTSDEYSHVSNYRSGTQIASRDCEPGNYSNVKYQHYEGGVPHEYFILEKVAIS